MKFLDLDKLLNVRFLLLFLIGIVFGGIGVSFFNLQDGKEVVNEWMTFMSILSTLFAVFFVYSGFRIETIKEELIGIRREVKDTMEFGIQLENCMSFIINKQYQKAIDALMGLKQEVFVYKMPERISTCYYFLAHCHHEKNTYDDSILALQYVNDIFEEKEMNPFKIEIIERFKELDKMR